MTEGIGQLVLCTGLKIKEIDVLLLDTAWTSSVIIDDISVPVLYEISAEVDPAPFTTSRRPTLIPERNLGSKPVPRC